MISKAFGDEERRHQCRITLIGDCVALSGCQDPIECKLDLLKEEIDEYTDEDLDNEKQHLLKNVSPFDVIEYIKNSIEILLNMKDDDIDELKEELA